MIFNILNSVIIRISSFILQFLVPPNQKVDYPMFLFCEGSSDELRHVYENKPSSVPDVALDTLGDDVHYECEEFEIL